MKDVAICEKPRWADKQALTRGYPNGATHLLLEVSHTESIGMGSEPRELKYLMYLEEKKSKEIP